MTFAMILVFIVLVIGMGLLNVLLLRRIWHPFYDTLSKLQFFDSNSQTALPLSKSSIKEFNNLNGVIKKMTERIRRDFSNLKEFTENASHELQTPLAIISSKLENILDNSDHLPIRHVKCIKEVHNTINRLTQLNRGLLLLTRIEGGRFSNREQVSIRAEIEAQLDQFEELIALKKISLQTSFNSQLSVFIHPSLTTVLVSTLLTNAILHNFENGSIKVEISGPVLLIENTGARLNVTTESLFERFKKGNQASSSIGLGLSIAKKICDKHKFDLSYKNVDTLHSISVTF
jgi:signal transduction histidine kinase